MKIDLKELIKKGESEKIEFKKSLAGRKEILETVSAFSNTKGGDIFVGIEENKDGSVKEVVGVNIKGKEIENLGNDIKQNTDPVIYPSIETDEIEGQSILVVEVKENPLKPVFAKIDKIPVAFKRVGKTNQKMDANELRGIISRGREFLWDSQICEGVTLDDIDWDFIENFFIKKYEKVSEKEFKSNPKTLLRVLDCIKDNTPTNAGILLFGKNPQKYFKNSYIALARYKGTSVGTERLDYREFRGNLFSQIDQCDRYVKEHIPIMSRLHPMQVEREDIPEYPFFPIRELIVNAVSHRDHGDQRGKTIIKMFKDRIEYYNPGGLPEGVTPENIVEEQRSRNPSIVDGLMKIRYIEGLGEGWDRIIEEFENHSLKPDKPIIKDLGDAVLVTIFAATLDFIGKFKDQLNERQIKLLDYLKTHKTINSAEYTRMFEIKDRQARADLSGLVSMELIIREGKARSTVYNLNPAVSGSIRQY